MAMLALGRRVRSLHHHQEISLGTTE